MTRLLLTSVVAVAATLAAPAAARADFVLDTFSNPTPGTIYQIALLNSNPYKAPTTAVGAGIARDVTVTVVAPLPPTFNGVSGQIGGGIYSMDTDNMTKATSEIKYTLTGAAGNLTGATGLQLAFLNMNPGNTSTGVATSTPVTVTVVTSGGTKSLTTTIAGNALPFTKSFAFSSFTGASWNLGSVSSITFTINGGAAPNTATDFALDEIRVKQVPAPAGLILAGIGLVGLVGRSRFTRKSVA